MTPNKDNIVSSMLKRCISMGVTLSNCYLYCGTKANEEFFNVF